MIRGHAFNGAIEYVTIEDALTVSNPRNSLLLSTHTDTRITVFRKKIWRLNSIQIARTLGATICKIETNKGRKWSVWESNPLPSKFKRSHVLTDATNPRPVYNIANIVNGQDLALRNACNSCQHESRFIWRTNYHFGIHLVGRHDTPIMAILTLRQYALPTTEPEQKHFGRDHMPYTSKLHDSEFGHQIANG